MQKIDPASYTFLQKLKRNNNREWFQKHKETFDHHYGAIKAWGDEVLESMQAIDDIEFIKFHRIYRDVRFSKDKTPYKSHFSAYMQRATALRRGGFYIHLAPGNTFVGGGFWAPERDDLKRIRDEIARDGDEFRAFLNDKTFKKHFNGLEGDQLKTAPRGYDKDHPDVDLLRFKQFIVREDFKDEDVFKPGFKKKVVASFQAMLPWFNYMSDVLTTDLNGERIV